MWYGGFKNSGDAKIERLKYFIDHFLNQFDVVFLQEFFYTGSTRLNVLVSEALRRGFRYHVSDRYKKINFGFFWMRSQE